MGCNFEYHLKYYISTKNVVPYPSQSLIVIGQVLDMPSYNQMNIPSPSMLCPQAAPEMLLIT